MNSKNDLQNYIYKLVNIREILFSIPYKNDVSLCNDFLYYMKEWKDFGGRVVGANLDEENISIPIEQYQVRHPTLLIIGLY